MERYYLGNETIEGFKKCDIDYIEEFFEENNQISLDLETTGLNYYNQRNYLSFDKDVDQILLCALAGETSVIVIDWRICGDDIVTILNKLENKHIIGYNLKFDLNFLRAAGVDFSLSTTFHDLFLYYSVLLAGYNFTYKKDLASCLKTVLNIDMSKDVRTSFIGMGLYDTFTKDQISYAADDVTYLIPLKDALHAKSLKFDLHRVIDLENNVLQAFVEMEFRGIYLNREKFLQVLKDHAAQVMSSIKQKLNNYLLENGVLEKVITSKYICGDSSTTFYLESPKHLQEILFQMGIIVKGRKKDPKTKTWVEKPTTEVKYLEEYMAKNPDNPDIDFLADLIEYKKGSKLLTTYYKIDENKCYKGRIHASFKQMGTATGRVACTKPNLQNIPRIKEFRNSFEAQDKDGWVITADYSNCEMRILAEAAGEEVMIEAFKRGDDIHSATAMMMFPELGVISKKVNSEYRNKQKAINFGTLYGATAFNLKSSFDDDFEAAQEALNKFFVTFPKVRNYQENSVIEIMRKGYAETLPPFNRKRFFPEPFMMRKKLIPNDFTNHEMIEFIDNQRYNKKNPEFLKQYNMAYREGTNHRIQGTNADMTKLATYNIYKLLRTKYQDAYIINQVHDEIVVELGGRYSFEEAEIIKNEIIDCMINASNMILKKCPMEVEAELCKSWTK